MRTALTTLFVCTTCRRPHLREETERVPCGTILLSKIVAAGKTVMEVQVVGQACLMGCEHGCNVAVAAEGKLTYVLGSFEPTTEASEAILDYARRHAASTTGAVTFRQWHQGIKGHFVARIPPLPNV